MSEQLLKKYYIEEDVKNKKTTPVWVNILLFLITFITCVIAGTFWSGSNPFSLSEWHNGMLYAVLILSFLSAHEFGHYFAARYHKVDVTLPFYIPFPFPFPGILNFGTFGAVIRTRDRIPTKKALFDIGVAGPLAGFVVCLGFLIYGFATLPGIEFIYHLHPEYLINYNGQIPDIGLHFGKTLLYSGFEKIFANPNGFVPPMNEIYHYPFLNVGWFGLFVTTLNLLPMGQLDGGHISYAMFGEKHKIIAKIMWWILVVIGIGALLGLSYELLKFDYESTFMNNLKNFAFPILEIINNTVPIFFKGWFGWLIWAAIAKFFIKLYHPPIGDDMKLDSGRRIIGWLAFVILILSFSFTGIFMLEYQ